MMGKGLVLAAFNAVAAAAADVSTFPVLPSFHLFLPFFSLPFFLYSFVLLSLPSSVTFLFLCETLTSVLCDAQRRPAAEAGGRGRMRMLWRQAKHRTVERTRRGVRGMCDGTIVSLASVGINLIQAILEKINLMAPLSTVHHHRHRPRPVLLLPSPPLF